MVDKPAPDVPASDKPAPDRPASEKSAGAYRTISEVAADLDLPQHVLRFWETRFPQVRPLKRAGGRRFYRPADVAMLRDIRTKLHDEGYTIKGVQRLLRERGKGPARSVPPADEEFVDGGLINGLSRGDGEVPKDRDAEGVEGVAPAESDVAPADSAPESLTESVNRARAAGEGADALREALDVVEACERRLRAALAPAP